ncbi:DUF6193 family natural product biosynthesis protein [Streptomyces sp. R11]|uniref:DUF6193 family natural product biosynthesis protein n=1 Tax=Streptomyces sp. R11 TaxID=3238625 RepID=A0AB39NBQ5_9ACTN
METVLLVENPSTRGFTMLSAQLPCFSRRLEKAHGVELITGATPDLADVVRAGAAWGQGRSLRELRAELSFLRSSKRAEAHERGPAAVVELQWRTMQEQAAEEPDFTGFGELVEAAHAEPRLRQLYVFSSHWTLGFSSCTRYPFRDEVAIVPSHNGSPFRVKRHLMDDERTPSH